MLKHWQYRVEHQVATLSLDRPNDGNNINFECLAELKTLSAEINADNSLRVVVLRGEGKHFSVGMDVSVISQMAGQDFDRYAEHLSAAQGCLDAFEAIDKPIVAQISGFCIGAGVILAACADFRVSSDKAIYSLPEVKRSIGVIMGLHRVTRLIGVAATKRMAMLGENFAAPEMQRLGFISELVTAEDLAAATARLTKKLLALPPQAVSLNKRIVDFSYREFLAKTQHFELQEQYRLNQTQDFAEAMKSFFEKRPARYTGK